MFRIAFPVSGFSGSAFRKIDILGVVYDIVEGCFVFLRFQYRFILGILKKYPSIDKSSYLLYINLHIHHFHGFWLRILRLRPPGKVFCQPQTEWRSISLNTVKEHWLCEWILIFMIFFVLVTPVLFFFLLLNFYGFFIYCVVPRGVERKWNAVWQPECKRAKSNAIIAAPQKRRMKYVFQRFYTMFYFFLIKNVIKKYMGNVFWMQTARITVWWRVIERERKIHETVAPELLPPSYIFQKKKKNVVFLIAKLKIV